MPGDNRLENTLRTSQHEFDIAAAAVNDTQQDQMADFASFVVSSSGPHTALPTPPDSQLPLYNGLGIPEIAPAALPSSQPSFHQLHSQLYWPPPTATVSSFNDNLVYSMAMDNIGGGDGPMPHIVAGGPLWMNDSSAPSSYYPQSQLDIAFTQMSSPYDQNQSASQPIQPYYPHDPAVYAVAGNSNSQALGFYDTSQATTSFAVGDGGSGSELFPREPAVMPLPIRAGTKCCSVCQATETPTWRRHMLTNKCVCNACGLYFKLHKRNRQFTHNARGQYVVKRQPRSTNKRPKNTRIYATQLNLIPSSAPDMPPAQRGDELTNVATDTTAAAVAAPPPDMEYMSTQGYNTAGGFRHYNV